MKHTYKALLTLAVLTVSAAAAQAAPVGMAARVVGGAEWKDGAAWKPLRVMQRLEAGDSVRCGPGESAIVVLFSNGARYSIGANQTATVAAGTVTGARPLGAPSGASAAVAQRLAGARTGAVMARPATNYERLHIQKPGEIVAGMPPSHDWLRQDERSFEVNPIEGAQSYTFTVFDSRDYVVFTQAVTPQGGNVTVTLPPELKLDERRPYTWRLHGFKDGRVLSRSRWGMTVVLNAADSSALEESVKTLLTANGKLPDDAADLAVLADLYRSYGVLQNSLEILDGDAFSEQPEIETVKGEIFAQAGIYAKALAAQARAASRPGGDN